MALRTFEEFLKQRNFTRAVDKVPFVNGTEARRGFEAWLAYNDSKLHAKLFHSNGNPRLTARFGCVAEKFWAQFLTTKSRDGVTKGGSLFLVRVTRRSVVRARASVGRARQQCFQTSEDARSREREFQFRHRGRLEATSSSTRKSF